MNTNDKSYGEELLSQKLNFQFETATNRKTTDADESQRSSNDPIDEFLSSCGMSMETIPTTVCSAHQRSPKEEIAFYSDRARTRKVFQDFWEAHKDDLPLMAALARSYNIRPVSSVSSEGLFSKASYVHRKHRSLMNDTTTSIDRHPSKIFSINIFVT